MWLLISEADPVIGFPSISTFLEFRTDTDPPIRLAGHRYWPKISSSGSPTKKPSLLALLLRESRPLIVLPQTAGAYPIASSPALSLKLPVIVALKRLMSRPRSQVTEPTNREGVKVVTWLKGS